MQQVQIDISYEYDIHTLYHRGCLVWEPVRGRNNIKCGMENVEVGFLVVQFL